MEVFASPLSRRTEGKKGLKKKKGGEGEEEEKGKKNAQGVRAK